MSRYIIKGGQPLNGEVSIRGAKNASYKQIIASLLSDKETQIAKSAASGQNGGEWGSNFRNLPRHKQTRVIAAICTASRLKNEGRS